MTDMCRFLDFVCFKNVRLKVECSQCCGVHYMPPVGAPRGWKVGAGNGPDVWGLEGELGGGGEGGQEEGGSEGQGGCTRQGLRPCLACAPALSQAFGQVNHQLPY